MANSASPSSMAMIIPMLLIMALTMMTMTMHSSATISCGQVLIRLAPCIPYVQNGGDHIPVACCKGVTSLNDAAVTTPDRQGVCNCIVTAARGLKYNNYSLRLAAGLPDGCGLVDFHYKINPSINCSTVT